MTIGIVAEGPRDQDIIESIADMLYPGSNYRHLQPESVAVEGGTYSGYKGVWQWCIKSKSIIDELNKIPSHKIDLYIIHLDGDTTREKNLHCYDSSICPVSAASSAAYCSKSYDQCPLEIDTSFISKAINEKMIFLQDRINGWITADIHEKLVFCLPFDSPESWIVAAFDGEKHGSPEMKEKPADNIIAQSSQYHRIRVARKDGKLKKAKNLYIRYLISKLCSEWCYVKSVCKSADYFESNLSNMMPKQSASYQ